jgi:D-amino-acid oxidase
MLEEIKSKAGDVNVETGIEYESVQHMVDDAVALGCDAVINATGLGAAKLCNDKQLVGARGILHHYDRETCVRKESIHEGEFGMMLNDAVIMTDEPPYGSETGPAYLIARGNIIVAGGCYLKDDPETDIRPEEHARLLRNADLLGIDTTKSKPIGEWTGFRPYRPTARCEIDKEFGVAENVKVIHSYGYGGSGWTVHVGAAKEATALLLSKDSE